TDFDELLQSLETPAKDEEVKLEPKAPVAPSSLNDKVKNETDEFIDVDTLLADISEMEDEPEIDLLKNIDSMPEPVSENEITDDDVFSSDLDLARVYIEMDDISEALDILKKVLLNGSTSQQAEAKQILTQLDNR
ncbi:MAG: FimV/HubP family polar landmark protein, partial [Glaciecola sp.]